MEDKKLTVMGKWFQTDMYIVQAFRYNHTQMKELKLGE